MESNNCCKVVSLSLTHSGSLAYELETKQKLYAQCARQQYWIIDAKAKCIHVHRQPIDADYSERFVRSAPGTLSPLIEVWDKPFLVLCSSFLVSSTDFTHEPYPCGLAATKDKAPRTRHRAASTKKHSPKKTPDTFSFPKTNDQQRGLVSTRRLTHLLGPGRRE
jgi:hypothetical protein